MAKIVWLLKDANDIVLEVKFRRSHADRPDIYLEYKVELPEPSGEPLPFGELTEAQVVSWLTNDLGILFEPIDDALQYQYDKIVANIEAELPWQ